MKYKLDSKFDYKKTFAMFSALALLFGLLCSAFSLFAVPFAAAYIAALIVFSFPKKHGAITAAAVSTAICVVGAAFGAISLFAALLAAVIGCSIGLTYVFGRTKTEAVAVTASLAVIVALLAVWIFSWSITGSATLTSMRGFYSEQYSLFKSQLDSSLRSQYASLGDQISGADLESAITLTMSYLDYAMQLLPAIFVIMALILSGFAFKMFGLTVYKHSKDTSNIIAWRFKTSNVFVIFYIISAIVHMFASETDVLTVSFTNLYLIMNFVYAYIGYNFVTALLAQKMRIGIARLIVIAAALMFSSFSVQILAIGGVVFTFICNKASSFPQNKNSLNDTQNKRNESEDDDEKQ